MAKNLKFKIRTKCEVCKKPILVWEEAEHLCKKHFDEKHKGDYAKLADFIMKGHA